MRSKQGSTVTYNLLGNVWKDNIRIDLRVIGWGGVEWMRLARDRDQSRVLVNTVIELQVSWEMGTYVVDECLLDSQQGLCSMELVN